MTWRHVAVHYAAVLRARAGEARRVLDRKGLLVCPVGMSLRPVRYAVATLLSVGALAACGQAQSGTGSASPTNGTHGVGGPRTTTTSTSTPTPTPTPTPSTLPATVPATGLVTLTGVPQAGVEASCVLLGHYLLVGGTPPQRALLTAATAAGSPVTLTGHTDHSQMSYCQQGTLLVVEEVRAGS